MGVTLCHSSASLLLNSRNKMPKGGGSGRSATGGGTNSSGNSYTSYSNSSGAPAGYSYSNANGSSYCNNGGGHGFYTSPSEGTKSSGGQATPHTPTTTVGPPRPNISSQRRGRRQSTRTDQRQGCGSSKNGS